MWNNTFVTVDTKDCDESDFKDDDRSFVFLFKCNLIDGFPRTPYSMASCVRLGQEVLLHACVLVSYRTVTISVFDTSDP